jgi:hypothetical protein
MAKLSPTPHRPTDPTVKFDDYSIEGFRKADAYVQKLQEASDAKDPDDPNFDIKGVVLCFPAGDGHAVYIVNKARPLTLEHIPVGDAWRAYPEGTIMRGLTPSSIIEDLRREKAFRAAFRR